jgi:nematocidal protein AidA
MTAIPPALRCRAITGQGLVMESAAAILPRLRKINAIAVIDAKYIKNNYKPNSDYLHPVVINPDSLFIVGTGLRSDSGKLEFKADIGDIISLSTTSADHNSNNAVITYGIKIIDHARLFHRFEQSFVTRIRTAQPDPESASRDGLPAIHAPASFASFQSTIQAHGAAQLQINFALYTLSENGQTQTLFGYYGCVLEASVQPQHPIESE